MDKAYSLLNSQSKIINILLLFCAGFSSIITLERPDYNLFLFLFVAFSIFWNNQSSKANPQLIKFERMLCAFTMAASLVADLLWIFTHKGINSPTIIYFSWIEFFVKIVVIGIVFIMWKGYKKEGTILEVEGTGFREFEEEDA